MRPPCTPPAARALASAEEVKARHGWWVVIDGRVHDVTQFVRRHPGGESVLRAHAGLDATSAFGRAHLDRPGRGNCSGPRTSAVDRARALHDAWVGALSGLVHLQNVPAGPLVRARGTDLCLPDGGRPSALQADRAGDTAARFGDDEYLPRFSAEVPAPLAERVLREQRTAARVIRTVAGRADDARVGRPGRSSPGATPSWSEVTCGASPRRP